MYVNVQCNVSTSSLYWKLDVRIMLSFLSYLFPTNLAFLHEKVKILFATRMMCLIYFMRLSGQVS